MNFRYDFLELNSKKRSKYCILIPVINEGERIKKQLIKMSSFSSKIDIIIVDGGSTDDSLNQDFLKLNGIKTLLTKLSLGKLSKQIQIGFDYAMKNEYQGVITIDGNNKDDVVNYTRFVDKLEEGYDFIQGSRFVKGGIEKNTPFFRKLGIKLIHAPLSSFFSGFKYTDTTNGFRGHSSNLIKSKKINVFNNDFTDYEILTHLSVFSPRLNFKVCEVPVTRVYPLNEKIPTKIKGFSGNFKILKTLFMTILKMYNE